MRGRGKRPMRFRVQADEIYGSGFGSELGGGS